MCNTVPRFAIQSCRAQIPTDRAGPARCRRRGNFAQSPPMAPDGVERADIHGGGYAGSCAGSAGHGLPAATNTQLSATARTCGGRTLCAGMGRGSRHQSASGLRTRLCAFLRMIARHLDFSHGVEPPTRPWQILCHIHLWLSASTGRAILNVRRAVRSCWLQSSAQLCDS